MTEPNNLGSPFVIPQKCAGRHFRKKMANHMLTGMRLETAGGSRLIEMSIRLSFKGLIPRIFRFPLGAWVTAISALVRVFGLKLIMDLQEDK